MIPRSYRSIFVLIFLALLGSVYQINAQSGVDLSYNGVPSLPLESNNPPQRLAIDANDKVLVWGGSLAIDGIARGQLARLSPDGTLDTGFTYCHCGLGGITNVYPLPDGKILAAGYSGSLSKIVRLNSDGSLDPNFTYEQPPSASGSSVAAVITVQSDGKIYASRTQGFGLGYSQLIVYRFNANGSFDSSFTPIAYPTARLFFVNITGLIVLPDGKFYLSDTTSGGTSATNGSLRRFNPDGTTDTNWEVPAFATQGFPPTSRIAAIDLLPDGRLLVAGNFDSVNGIGKPDIVRLMPAGNVDLSFTGPVMSPASTGTGMKRMPGGKILFSSSGGAGAGNRIARLDADGTPDATFLMAPKILTAAVWSVDSMERVILLGANNGPFEYARLLLDGSSDGSFVPNIGTYGRVHVMARQSDGRVIVAGDFNRFNGTGRVSVARTNADGTTDTSFNAGSGFNQPPKKMAIQADGKIIAVGPFTSYNGTSVPGIVRLLSDGAIDPLFSVAPNAGAQIIGLDLLADGRFMISGTFMTINGTSRAGVARLHNDGTVDNGFNALVGGTPTINEVLIQADGRVMIGGSFSGVGGFNRSNLVRLETGGALDQTFTASNTGSIGGLWLALGGKYLISGIGGDSVGISRRNGDGTSDTTFSAPAFLGDNGGAGIHAAVVAADGSVIVGGSFYAVGSTSRQGIVRLTATGAVDPLFLPASADGRVRTIADAGGGKVYIGGDFARIETTTKPGLARLNVAPYRKVAPFDFDGDGKTDIAAYRPSTNVWYILHTSDWSVVQTNFGSAGDIVAPADFDGDGKADPGIFRPSTGDWWYAASTTGGGHRTAHHGVNGDIPRPSDFDGDGKADMIVYRPSNGTWYRLASNGSMSSIQFGAPGDQPVVGDFDGDGKSDPAVFRPSTGDWWYAASSAGYQHRAGHWGQTGDLPAPADYDGDGKTDLAVFRPSEGGWYVLRSSNLSYFALSFGLNGDRPIPGDYDGDGSVDIAVFRPSNGLWYLLQTTAGFGALQWGLANDVVIPNAFVP